MTGLPLSTAEPETHPDGSGPDAPSQGRSAQITE